MRIGINGLGRIGKQFLIAAIQQKMPWDFAINDPSGLDYLVYSLKHDSIHPSLSDVSSQGNNLIINKKKIPVFHELDPENIPWKENKVDLVVECTGLFTEKRLAEKHLKAGAKKVIISAPAKSPDATIVFGVNDSALKKEHKILSAGSCTTNATAPLIKALHDAYNVKNSYFVTVHAYTATQKLIDSHADKDYTRGRAAALNIVPTTSGAATSVVESIPELKGKIDGYALRVPVSDGSIVSVIANVSKPATAKDVNSLFKKLSETKWKGILDYVEHPLVSTDIINNSKSCIFNSCFTSTQDNTISIAAWYDNEWGYACRLVDLAKLALK